MSVSTENKKFNKITLFVDFIPAELRTAKDWLVVYYAKNPVSQKLERQRIRVPKISNNSERLKFGKRMVVEINDKLQDGWSPFLNESGKNFKGWNETVSEFQNNLQKLLKDNSLRKDSLRTYNSNMNLVQQFIQEKKMKITFALEINKVFCVKYLDWIYIERGNSPRTRNNHLIFLKLFCNFLVGRGILAENPTNGIKNLQKTQKKRIYIPKEVRIEILKEIETYDNAFHVVAKTIYYCMIRNTELGKIQVNNVNLDSDSIFIPKEISKNKKDEVVSIPEDLKKILANHIKNANPSDFLFSSNNFLPGSKQMPVRKIQSQWDKLRIKLNLKKEYQFYSLKDTGITDLFLEGIPSLKIRNQARHSSLQITELYTPRNMNCDEIIRTAKNKF